MERRFSEYSRNGASKRRKIWIKFLILKCKSGKRVLRGQPSESCFVVQINLDGAATSVIRSLSHSNNGSEAKLVHPTNLTSRINERRKHTHTHMHEGWKLRLKSREDNAHDFAVSELDFAVSGTIHDLSSPESSSIVLSILSFIQTLTSNDILKQSDRELEGWAVPISATVACAAARRLLSMMRLSLANSSSVMLAVLPSSSFKKMFPFCSDLSFV